MPHSFFAYTEGTTHATVRFLNEKTGESLLYLFTFVAAGIEVVQDAIPPLSATVRQSLTHNLVISNPLETDATIASFACSNPAVFVQTPVVVPARSQGSVPLLFRPLVPQLEQAETLSIVSPQLGEFKYRLVLSARAASTVAAATAIPAAGAGAEGAGAGKPGARSLKHSSSSSETLAAAAESKSAGAVGVLAGPQHKALTDKTLKFSTSLGNETIQTFRFVSFATKATTYECKIEGKEFAVATPSNGKVAVAGAEPGARSEGVPVAVEVRYEPSALGDVHDVLVVSSPEGGVYTCALHGHCDPPKPQGPVVLRLGASASLPFRNVLDVPETFTFAVDNAAFQLKSKSEKIARKAAVQIGISFKPAEKKAERKGAGAAAAAEPEAVEEVKPVETGRLIVSCPAIKNASWVFYLQGIRPTAGAAGH